MADRITSRLWNLLVVVAIGGTALSVMGSSSEVQAVVRACCFADGHCEDLTRSICEDSRGGMSQTPGDFCADVTCPLLCSGSSPECNGACDPGTTCVPWLDGSGGGGGAQAAPTCGCMPEIPQGGACQELANACAGGLPCEDGFCCEAVCGAVERCDVVGSEGVCTSVAAAAPAVSNLGLSALVSILIVLGFASLMRRRRLD